MGTAAAIISILGALFQVGKGIYDTQEAKKNRPKYEIPEVVKQSLGLAQMQFADKQMPGESKMKDSVNLTAANAVKAAQESGNGVGAVTQIQANQDSANRQIGIASAQDNKSDLATLLSQLGNFGQYQDTKWQLNKFAPYAQQYNQGREEIGAGAQNLTNSMALMSFMNQGNPQGLTSQQKYYNSLNAADQKTTMNVLDMTRKYPGIFGKAY